MINDTVVIGGEITLMNTIDGDLNTQIVATDLYPATTDTLGGIIVGEDLTITHEGVLSVVKSTQVEQDNTHPITSAAVYTEIGNIDVLLQTI